MCTCASVGSTVDCVHHNVSDSWHDGVVHITIFTNIFSCTSHQVWFV